MNRIYVIELFGLENVNRLRSFLQIQDQNLVITTRVNGPRRTRKKYSRVALKSATRVFCSVLVQGFGPPRGTPHVPRVRLY